MQGHPNVIYNCGSVNVVFYSYRQHFRRYLRQIQVQLAVNLNTNSKHIFSVDPAPVDQQPPAYLSQPQALQAISQDNKAAQATSNLVVKLSHPLSIQPSSRYTFFGNSLS